MSYLNSPTVILSPSKASLPWKWPIQAFTLCSLITAFNYSHCQFNYFPYHSSQMPSELPSRKFVFYHKVLAFFFLLCILHLGFHAPLIISTSFLFISLSWLSSKLSNPMRIEWSSTSCLTAGENPTGGERGTTIALFGSILAVPASLSGNHSSLF